MGNNEKCVPLWQQKAGRDEDGLVTWDYHVILIVSVDSETLVYDLDTKLPFPQNFQQYCRETFRDESTIIEKFHRKFRVVSGSGYLTKFSSDRRHMRKEDEGRSWLSPPPTWPCIKGDQESDHNLDTFVSMDQNIGVGQVLDFDGFIQKFSS